MVMRSVGLETKNHCAGEGQQQVTGLNVVRTQKDRPPPLVEEESPLLNTCVSRREQICWS
jgi:hypothetical protein